MSFNPLLDVLHRRVAQRRPVWFMRQAGRYLPEYRALRAKVGSFLGLCYDPELAAEITLQPMRRFDLDAAIVFSDILVLPNAMGLPLKFVDGEGPVLATVRCESDVRMLTVSGISGLLSHTAETIRKVRSALALDKAVIGFCGAPWTVASYMIGGGVSDGRQSAHRIAVENPPWFERLLDILVEESANYLCLQIEAGADVVQIFDSWAGELPTELHDRIVFGPIARICGAVRERHGETPIIVFGRGLGSRHSELARKTGADAAGIEAGVDLARTYRELPAACAVQGNLDPVALCIGGPVLDDSVDTILAAVPLARHIFNLGHGVRPETDPAMISRVIERVRRFDEARLG
jgi:uroporphyrinogen decarboxylase